MGAKVQAGFTSITSNAKCAHHYGSRTQSKWLEVTVVESKHELSKSGTHQDWYIAADYILGEDFATKRVHIIQRKVKFVLMPPSSTDAQYQNEKSQEGNGDLTLFAEVLNYETIIMAITVVSDIVLVAPVINPL